MQSRSQLTFLAASDALYARLYLARMPSMSRTSRSVDASRRTASSTDPKWCSRQVSSTSLIAASSGECRSVEAA